MYLLRLCLLVCCTYVYVYNFNSGRDSRKTFIQSLFLFYGSLVMLGPSITTLLNYSQIHTFDSYICSLNKKKNKKGKWNVQRRPLHTEAAFLKWTSMIL